MNRSAISRMYSAWRSGSRSTGWVTFQIGVPSGGRLVGIVSFDGPGSAASSASIRWRASADSIRFSTDRTDSRYSSSLCWSPRPADPRISFASPSTRSTTLRSYESGLADCRRTAPAASPACSSSAPPAYARGTSARTPAGGWPRRGRGRRGRGRSTSSRRCSAPFPSTAETSDPRPRSPRPGRRRRPTGPSRRPSSTSDAPVRWTNAQCSWALTPSPLPVCDRPETSSSSSFTDSSGRRIDGSRVSGPASFIRHDSRTVPPAVVKIPMRSGGPPAARAAAPVAPASARVGSTPSRNGRANSAPAPRRNLRREIAMPLLRGQR